MAVKWGKQEQTGILKDEFELALVSFSPQATNFMIRCSVERAVVHYQGAKYISDLRVREAGEAASLAAIPPSSASS